MPLSATKDLKLMADISTVYRATTTNERFFNNNKNETAS